MKILYKIALGVLIILFTHNTVNAQVQSAYNIKTDFHKYKTYSFGGWEKYGTQELNDFDKGRFLAAFKEEFVVRNMTFVPDSADVVFTLLFAIDVGSITYVNDGRNKPQNMKWDNGQGLVNVLHQQIYEVGTVRVDFFDGETKKQVGQATMLKPVTNNEKKHDKKINKAVKSLMKKYPVVAKKI